MPVDLSMIGLEGIKAHYDVEESKSRANYNNVLADTGRAKLEQDAENDRLMQLATERVRARNQDPNAEDSDAVPLDLLGQEMVNIGAPEMGAELLKKSSEIRENEAQTRQAEFTARKNQTEVTIKTGEYVSQLLFPGMSDKQFNAAVSQLERAQQAGEIFLPEGTIEKVREYGNDPEIVALWQNHAISAVDQAKLDLQAQTQSRLAANAERAQAHAEQMAQIAMGRLQIARELADHTIANGGANKPSVLTPTAEDIKRARAQVKSEIFANVPEVTKTGKVAPNPAIDAAANYIAADVKQRMKDNPALPYNLALNQAITAAKSQKVFYTTEDPETKKKTHHFNQYNANLGKSPTTALPVPADRKMKPNTYYLGADGKSYLWDGKGFLPAN